MSKKLKLSNKMDIDDDEEESKKVYETREYQILLLEEAIKSNVILYLPTGSGKTYIAQMLIRHFGEEIEKPFSQGGKRSFFLCTTQALLYQQGRVLRRLLPFHVGYFTGADAVDYWTDRTWFEVLDKYQVIALTAQILLNLIQSNRIQFRQISVIIFDECHHADANHPMKQIADLYKNQFKAGLCTTRIMGLTATLLNADTKGKQMTSFELQEQIRKLESTLCARIISCDSEEVIRSSTNPTEEIKTYEVQSMPYVIGQLIDQMAPYFSLFDNEQFETLKAAAQSEKSSESQLIRGTEGVQSMMPIVKKPNSIKDLKRVYDELMMQFKDHGLNAGNATALMMMLALLKLQLGTDQQFLALIFESVLSSLIVLRHKISKILNHFDKSDRFLQYNTPKIQCLLRLLVNYQPDKRTLIFCQRRVTVKALYYLLKNLSKHNTQFKNIVPDFMVGVSTHLIQNTFLSEFTKKQDKLVMHNFNKGITNVLITTDVLEEGIDIQSCNTVIKFDPPQHTRSYVQSKGRARSMGSQYLLMVNQKDYPKYLAQYEYFKNMEIALKAVARQKRLEIDNFDGTLNVTDLDEKPNIYYVDGLESACISESGAPMLLFYYIATQLQYDKFSNVAPSIFKVYDSKTGAIKLVLRMPISCPIYEDINSDWITESKNSVSRPKLALQSAAFQACKLLHQKGELNDDLRVLKKFFDEKKDLVWLPNWYKIENIEHEEHLIGESLRSEHYDINIPLVLQSYPEPNQACYIHIINLKTMFSKKMISSDERYQVYEDFINHDDDFAIITRSKLSKICDFPIYDQFGDVIVSLNVNHHCQLNEEQLQNLHGFHAYIFRQILPECLKSFLVSNNNKEHGEDNNYIIAPIMNSTKTSVDIDWNLVESVKNLTIVNSKIPDQQNRNNFIFNEEKYLHKVVIPWHNSDNERRSYVVTNVTCETPLQRARGTRSTIEQYIWDTYQLPINNKDQSMLEVLPMSTNTNYITPKANVEDDQKNIPKVYLNKFLLPEFCNLVNFPAVYWMKAHYLPSILNRFVKLLACEELRLTFGYQRDGFLNDKLLINDSQYAPLRKASCVELSGKKETYTLLDLDSKQRKKTIAYIKQNQTIELLGTEMKELKLNVPEEEDDDDLDDKDGASVFSDDGSLEDGEMKDEMYDTFLDNALDLNIYGDIEKDLDDVTLMDILMTENSLRAVQAPLLDMSIQYKEVLKKNEVKLYDLKFESSPKINILSMEFDDTTCAGPGQKDIFEAMTTFSAREIVNNETLRNLGDAMLTFAASLALFTHFQSYSQARLLIIRNHITHPRNLYLSAREQTIPSYINACSFEPLKSWLPPMFSVPKNIKDIFIENNLNPALIQDFQFTEEEMLTGDLSEESTVKVAKSLANLNENKMSLVTSESNKFGSFIHKIGLNDKVIADDVKALTGVYLKYCGIEGAFHFLQFLNILPNTIVNIHKTVVEPHPSAVRSPRACNPLKHVPNYAVLEERLQYKFNDKSFLLEALTHPTYNANRVTTSFQRLQFLGGSIIDFLVTSYLFEHHKELTSIDVSNVRSAVVNNVSFASYSCRIGLYKYLLFDSSTLNEFIGRFVRHQEARNHEISDEIFFLLTEHDVICTEHGGDLKNRVVEKINIPKALGDVFEAIIGAIYIDSHKCLEKTWYYLYNIIKKELSKWIENPPKNAIAILHELNCQPEFISDPLKDRTMITLNVISPKTRKRMSFYGVGQNKKKAKLAAAKIALQHIL